MKTGFVSSAPNSFCTFYFTWSQLQWGMLQRTVFINKIRMLQRTRSNTIGRRNTRVRMTCSIIVFTRKRLFIYAFHVR